jgi:hypothetical protein
MQLQRIKADITSLHTLLRQICEGERAMTMNGPDLQGGNGDQIWGTEAISAVINLTPRQTFYLLEHGRLPARKVGKRWTASVSVLRQYLAGEAA